VRLFLAAEPSAGVQAAARSCARRLRERLESARAARGIRWIPGGNLHLTVWFLGEVSDARAPAVFDALRAPLDVAPFDLHLSGFGAFPPSGPPGVLWMGVTGGLEALSRAHERVGARLQPWGFAAEGRAYSAHLTIARVKAPPHGAARAAMRQALEREPADAGRCRITELTLFRSRTTPSGALYERLLRVPLR
jgi:2'-5' RNA ligase